jgi:hypothetical protein
LPINFISILALPTMMEKELAELVIIIEQKEAKKKV